VRDEQQIADAPFPLNRPSDTFSRSRERRNNFILHEIETRQFIVPDGVHHRVIRAIGDGLADSRFLTFKLIPETTSSR